MTTWELITFIVAAIGVAFMFISGIGIVRLPDVYTRMHAAGKATTLGVSCILLAAGLYYGTAEMIRMIIFIILFFITGPIATTAMSRAAYRTDAKRSLVLHYDDLAAGEGRDHPVNVDRSSLP